LPESIFPDLAVKPYEKRRMTSYFADCCERSFRIKACIELTAIFFVVAVNVGQCAEKSKRGPSIVDPNIMAKLRELKPLPKVHFSWTMEGNLLDEYESGLLYELARIMRSLSVQGESGTEKQIDNCVYTCARVNKTKPEIPCSIGVNYSPWHRKFGKDLPPTDRGPTYYAEINFFAERMMKIKTWVANANKKYGSDVKIGAILLDSERFYIRENDDKWNDAIREALDAIHLKAESIFPGVRIQWHCRGVLKMGGTSWGKTPYFTGKEIKSPLSTAFFRVPEQELMREQHRRTCALAEKLGIEEVTVGIALASGYRRGLETENNWDYDWDYDLIYSYQLGYELNHPWFAKYPEVYAPYDHTKIITFYPAPFYHESPAWGKHFIAYVRGATGVKYLKDLGFDR